MADTSSALLECCICLETVAHADPIWCCRACFIEVHLGCAQAHATSALRPLSKLLASSAFPSAPKFWGCPHCRAQLGERDYPASYSCYCGKVANPTPDPWLPPHACGGVCGAPRPSCAHTCRQQCHAGPCAPCTVAVDVNCFCGRVTRTTRCGQPRASCGEPCGRKGAARAGEATTAAAAATLAACFHSCRLPCHDGACPPCEERMPMPCACRRAVAVRACKDRLWRCEGVCGKKLACGRHSCALVCHSGPCSECPTSGPRSCFCGKARYAPGSRACDEPTLSCGDTCGLALPGCGHPCSARCHAGPCGPCGVVLEGAACRCGRTRQRHVCSEGPLLCNVRCNETRDCGRHQCRRRCCNGRAPEGGSGSSSSGGSSSSSSSSSNVAFSGISGSTSRGGSNASSSSARISNVGGSSNTGNTGCGSDALVESRYCPPCREVCSRKLSCGHHSCASFCHAGPCLPCPLTVGVSCPCGATRVTVPCGSERRVRPPVCRVLCQRPSLCDHESAPHPCHAGACPPCALACGRALARCEHPCAAPCHNNSAFSSAPSSSISAAKVAPALVQSTESGGPADGRGRGSACPPCAAPVRRMCVGGHEERTTLCSAPALFRCGARCGAALPCGRHACEKACHALSISGGGGGGAGSSSSGSSGGDAAAPAAAPHTLSCGRCLRPCSLLRPIGCTHPCRGPAAAVGASDGIDSSSNSDSSASGSASSGPVAGAAPCHPGACAPCGKAVSRPCHCGRTVMAVPCIHVQAAAALDAAETSSNADISAPSQHAHLRQLFSCAQRCRLPHAGCGHACSGLCHPSADCERVAPCDRTVTVRCRCGRLKEEWACERAVAVRARGGAAGGSRDYGTATALWLLPCSSECATIAPPATAAAAAADGGGDGEEGPQVRTAAEAAAATALRKRRKQEAAEDARRAAVRAAEGRAATDARRRECRARALPIVLLSSLGVAAVGLLWAAFFV